jgi:PAS domain S-box-containing protein
MPNVEVAYSTSRGVNSLSVGIEAATIALDEIKEHPVVLMLIHIKGSKDVERVLEGVASVVEDAPVIGMSSGTDEDDHEIEVSAIAVASPFIKVTIGVGTEYSTSPEKAANEAISGEELETYFGTNREEHWRDRVGVGKSVIGMILACGDNLRKASHLDSVLRVLRENSDDRIQFIGGNVLSVSGRAIREIFHDRTAYHDAFLLLLLETHLSVGVGTSDGLSPTGECVTITKASQKEILEIDGTPACQKIDQMVSKPVLFGVVDSFGNSRNIPYKEDRESKSLLVMDSQPVGTKLNVVASSGNDLREAGEEAFKKSIIRGSIDEPVLAVVFSSIYRRQLLGNSALDELQLSIQSRLDMRLVAFDTGVESCLTDEGLNRSNYATVTVLTLGDELSYAAEVAMENKELVNRLQIAEASQRALLDLIPDPVIATDTTLQITHWNPRVQGLLGYGSDEVLGLSVTRVLHPRLRWTLENAAKKLRESDFTDSIAFEAEVLRTDNVLIPVEVVVSFNPHEKKYCYVIAFHDITEHKTTQSILDRERNAYKAIAEATINTVGINDLCNITLKGIMETLEYDIGTLRLYNPKKGTLDLAASIGLDDRALEPGLHIRPFEDSGYLGTDSAFNMQAIFSSDITQDPSLSERKERLDPLGVRALVIWPMQDSSGRLLGVLNIASFTPKKPNTESRTFFEVLAGMVATVIERRQTQQALSDSEAKVRTVIQSMKDIVFVYDEDDKYSEIYCDDPSLLIADGETLIGSYLSDSLPVDVGSKLLRSIKRVRETKEPETLDYSLTIEGKVIWFSGSISLHEDGKSIVVVSRNITTRKKAEDRLARRMEYEKALADISQSLLLSDGLSPEAFNSALTILRSISKADRVYVTENIVDSNNRLSMRLVADNSADGVTLDSAIIGYDPVLYEPDFARWAKELSTGQVIMGDVQDLPRIEADRLQSLGIKSILVLPLRDKSKWTGFVGFDIIHVEREWTDEDVTLLRTASEMISAYSARASVEAELRSSLRDLELYSSILRHDFANDITLILNQIEVGEIAGLDYDRLREIMETSKLSAERMSQVLSVFNTEGKTSRYQVKELLETVVLNNKKSNPDMTVLLRITPDSAAISISGGRLLPMVFSNLLRNVHDYAGDNAIVTIESSRIEDGIEFIVEDNGPGVDPAIRPRLFEQGVSTTGGGLGLYLSKKVIEGYRGTIEYIDGRQGACFRIVLPTS